MNGAASAAEFAPESTEGASPAETPQPVGPGMRPPDASPIERLLAKPQGFEFHQSVRLLQGLLRRLPADERPAVRFRNSLSLSFPASELLGVDTHRRALPETEAKASADADRPPGEPATSALDADAPAALERIELTPAFMGLLGVNGALPYAYSEQFAQREGASRDGAARAFLDIFQHRAVSLFHEAWRKHRLPLQFELDRRERYLPLVLSLVGLGEPGLQRRLQGDSGGVGDDALAFYAGLLQRRVVSAHHLQRVLADYFGVPVNVTQFVGRWFVLDDDCQVTLGETPRRLGRDTVLGPRIWQRDLRARMRIGPMNRAQHRRFLPGGSGALALRELLTLVSGVSIEYEVQLTLRAAEVTGAALVNPDDRADETGPRLGWDSYLVSRPCEQDRTEAVYDLQPLAA